MGTGGHIRSCTPCDFLIGQWRRGFFCLSHTGLGALAFLGVEKVIDHIGRYCGLDRYWNRDFNGNGRKL